MHTHKRNTFRFKNMQILVIMCVARCCADEGDVGLFNEWLGISANFDGGYHKTQLFEDNHNTGVLSWDTRAEVWLPPHQGEFSYGPYIRFGGIAATERQAWEDAYLSAPGLGFQAYPFSLACFRQEDSAIGKIFGPLRLFGEYNYMDYWGSENEWRPDHQMRTGTEYWREVNVNNTTKPWWWEFWNGLYWQSANEFDQHYESWIFAQALRTGIRRPGTDILACFTPYVALESSLTENKEYYWENRMLAGGGIRFTPSLSVLPQWLKWVNRVVLYAEYMHVGAYYGTSAPSSVPDHDVRVGVSFSVGQWYHGSDYGTVSVRRMKVE